jgi:hypothetical protein
MKLFEEVFTKDFPKKDDGEFSLELTQVKNPENVDFNAIILAVGSSKIILPVLSVETLKNRKLSEVLTKVNEIICKALEDENQDTTF